jgi:hypothetical protein
MFAFRLTHEMLHGWQCATLLLSLLHIQVLLGLVQLLLGFRSPSLTAKKMQLNALIADHEVFASSKLTGSLGFAVHAPFFLPLPCAPLAFAASISCVLRCVAQTREGFGLS